MTAHDPRTCNRLARLPSVYLCATLLAVSVSLWQIRCCGYLQLDLSWTYNRSQAVIDGTSISPWQYRVLSHWAYSGLTSICHRAGFDDARHEAAGLLRLLQSLAIFGLAVVYYRKLGLGDGLITLGLSVLASGMLHTLYFADLSFDTYSDVIFYAAAACLILYKQTYWILVLMPLAALNRETCGLIPFMLIAHSFADSSQRGERIRNLLIGTISLALYLIILAAVRHHYGSKEGMAGHSILSWHLIGSNLIDEQSWIQLLVTMGIVPILAICSLRVCPSGLRPFFWSLVPAWFLIHFLSAVVAETRLFLVPMVVVLVPCMLFGVARSGSTSPDHAA